MKTLRVMGIIGIVWCSLWTYRCLDLQLVDNTVGCAGCAYFIFMYSLAFFIVAIVQSSKGSKQ